MHSMRGHRLVKGHAWSTARTCASTVPCSSAASRSCRLKELRLSSAALLPAAPCSRGAPPMGSSPTCAGSCASALPRPLLRLALSAAAASPSSAFASTLSAMPGSVRQLIPSPRPPSASALPGAPRQSPRCLAPPATAAFSGSPSCAELECCPSAQAAWAAWTLPLPPLHVVPAPRGTLSSPLACESLQTVLPPLPLRLSRVAPARRPASPLA
jgi:hypothetical protein